MVMIFQLGGNIDCILRNPPGLTTQFNYETTLDHTYDEALISFLLEKGEIRGYTNYWVSYPIAFKTEEKVIFIPSLTYHDNLDYTERDNRYPPYNNQVRNSEKTAYITTRQPALEAVLKSGFGDLGIAWQETSIGDFRIFYGLSRAVHPEELGLGKNTP
jgi:hypothetical protein